jgi:hypothetical protein
MSAGLEWGVVDRHVQQAFAQLGGARDLQHCCRSVAQHPFFIANTRGRPFH